LLFNSQTAIRIDAYEQKADGRDRYGKKQVPAREQMILVSAPAASRDIPPRGKLRAASSEDGTAHPGQRQAILECDLWAGCSTKAANLAVFKRDRKSCAELSKSPLTLRAGNRLAVGTSHGR